MMRTISALGATSKGHAAGIGYWLEITSARLRRFVAARAARRQLANDVALLYRLPEVELHDMGLNRGDLPAILRGKYRRD